MKSHSSQTRILILGDSLCLPRKQPEIVNIYQTWPSLLNANSHFEIIQIAIGGGTLKTLNEQSVYYVANEPDIVIIQSGIVDCAPRALGWLEREIVNSNRLLGFLIHHFFPINLMRKYRKKTYTQKKYFRKLIKELVNRYLNSQIIWIGILPASNEYERIVPGISKNIDAYNSIIASEIVVSRGIYLNVNSIPRDCIMTDHHHLNIKGHRWLYEEISALLPKEENGNL